MGNLRRLHVLRGSQCGATASCRTGLVAISGAERGTMLRQTWPRNALGTKMLSFQLVCTTERSERDTCLSVVPAQPHATDRC